MTRARVLGTCLVLGLGMSGLALAAHAAPWTRGYVVSNYDPAWYYGGKPGFTREGQLEPGSACPNGSSEPAAALEYPALFRPPPWPPPKEVENVINPPGYD